mmetsp:Transcript_116006/g.339198  ORF Transcript_116006/g.339198 Transcript_116006/m.339198 type:complete len:263 (+) Transcript_116006:589-1377(+)
MAGTRHRREHDGVGRLRGHRRREERNLGSSRTIVEVLPTRGCPGGSHHTTGRPRQQEARGDDGGARGRHRQEPPAAGQILRGPRRQLGRRGRPEQPWHLRERWLLQGLPPAGPLEAPEDDAARPGPPSPGGQESGLGEVRPRLHLAEHQRRLQAGYERQDGGLPHARPGLPIPRRPRPRRRAAAGQAGGHVRQDRSVARGCQATTAQAAAGRPCDAFAAGAPADRQEAGEPTKGGEQRPRKGRREVGGSRGQAAAEPTIQSL